MVLAAVLAVVSLCAEAQQRFVLPLYAGGGTEKNLQTTSVPSLPEGWTTCDSVPDVTISLPQKEKATGQLVVICPGGGYGGLAITHEGYMVADWLNARGIAAAILRYRLPHGHWEIPLEDVLSALELAKAKAPEWNVDPAKVGVMGFSAGGHLASTALTHFTSPNNRPAFGILVYPVITMDERYTHQGSRENLIGKEGSAELVHRFSNEAQVTKETPPTFLALSDDDETVVPYNSILFYNALKTCGVPAEMHIYPSGGHGWGFRGDFPYAEEFYTALARWVREQNGQ